jgi:hypothetical protein
MVISWFRVMSWQERSFRREVAHVDREASRRYPRHAHVAAIPGAATHPAWHHDIAAHPDQVWAEVSGTRHLVTVDQLGGAQRDAAWAQAIQRAPGFNGYVVKTDRELPLLWLTPAP